MNEHGEFVDDFDPYQLERRENPYAEVLGGNDVEDKNPRRCAWCGRALVERNGTNYCSKRCRFMAWRKSHES